MRTAWLAAAALLAAGCGQATEAAEDAGGVAHALADIGFDGAQATDASAQAEVAAGADAGSTPVDTGGEPVPGAFGTPCGTGEDCDSGFCLPGPDGKVCTTKCVDTCAAGYTCAGVQSGSDIAYVCVPRHLHLCDPCESDEDCKHPLLGEVARCLSYGDEGSFCGVSCAGDADCPAGYACTVTKGAGGRAIGQCRRVGGLCACSKTAVANKLATTCAHSSPWGTCKGVRGCSEAGLSPCGAAIPAAEACNGIDDDCDGETDEDQPPTPCALSNERGVCSGVLACSGGKTSCTGAAPAKEVCDGKDNDCDGQVDQGACDDGNPCTSDACNLSLGGCVFAQVTMPCDDGDVCTASDTCKAGECAGQGVSCDDGIACTADHCESAGSAPGCKHDLAPGSACDDGDGCTASDVCIGTGGGGVACKGVPLPDGASCTDGSACTLSAACEGGACKVKASKCDDANPCTDDGCDAIGGGVPACKHLYNIAACDDGNACTAGDACFAGKCIGLGKTPCDDQDPCTLDGCEAAKGCTHAPGEGAPCSDGNLCTTSDACRVAGGKASCTGKPIPCSDGNPCTSDACNPAFGCEHTFVVGPCDDGDKCTEGERCAAGQCKGGVYVCGECSKPGDCAAKEDGDLCNGTLYCNKATHKCAVNPATVLKCPAPVGGAAVCVTSACEPKTGACVLQPAHQGKACDDGNACTAKDACDKGMCVGVYGSAACDDDNPCTRDACDPSKGCKTTALNGIGCTDGNACTLGDACKAGTCKGGPKPACDDGNPCTTDGCDPAKGCVHNLNTLPCDDGSVCTTGDVCKGGVCTPVKALSCDDHNICTLDGCDPKKGCTHKPNDGLFCNDGNACTSSDICKAAKCIGAGALPCSDGNPCTTDGCDPKSGCTFKPNTDKCNDGNACTSGDACQGGGCKAGKPLDCNDANTCTVDLCDPAKGCAYQALVNGTPCNDGDLCTRSDRCAGGICHAGKKVTCNDGQACTTDACNPKKGCVFTPLKEGTKCDDGTPCTLVDKCAKGKCVGKGSKDLDKDGHVDAKCPGGDDCDDTSAKAHPGLKEVCDDLDNDCKKGVDDGCDDDNDGWCDEKMTIPAGITPKTCQHGGGDCDDTKSGVHPGAVEKLEVDIDAVALEPGSTVRGYRKLIDAAGGKDGARWLAFSGNQPFLGLGSQTYVAFRGKDDPAWTFTRVPGRYSQTAALAVDGAGAAHLFLVDPQGRVVHAAWTELGWSVEAGPKLAGGLAYPSIAVQGSGGSAVVHLAWWSQKTADLRYARRAGGKWTTYTIDSQGDVGRFASMAVDGKGAVHIAYLDYTNQDLKYATDAGSPGKFTITLVDGKTSAAGFHASLAVSPTGAVHVAYYELLGSDLRHAWKQGGTWSTETVESAGTVGQLTDIAVGQDGAVHVAYMQVDQSARRYAVRSGGKWAITTLHQGASGKAYLALSGKAVGLCEGRSGSRNLYCSDKEGGKWSGGFVDQDLGWVYPGTDLRLGAVRDVVKPGEILGLSNNRYAPAALTARRWLGKGFAWRTFANPQRFRPLAAARGTGGLVHACGRYHMPGKGEGGMAVLSGGWSGGFKLLPVDGGLKTGEACSIAAGAGDLHVAYHDAGNSVMRYARVAKGAVKSVEIPDPSLGTGSRQELRVAPDGRVVIAYAGTVVRVASRKPGGTWQIETVSSSPSGPVGLAISAKGTWHVVYVGPRPETSGSAVLVRRKTGGAWSAPAIVRLATASEIGAVAGPSGALHIVLAGNSPRLGYATDRFGGWSLVTLPGGRLHGVRTAPGVALTATGRVIAAACAQSWPYSGVVLSTFTYENLVDDNCDGK